MFLYLVLPNGVNVFDPPGLDPKKTQIGGIVGELLPYIFAVAGVVLLIFLIIGGLRYITSGGDPKSTKGARDIITNAIIGFVVVFASYWILQIFSTILHLGF